MIVVFLGPPGSGKGTQAKRLSAERNWPQLSTGDMLRAAIALGTDLGKQAKSYMDQGSLVPDSLVIGLIAERSLQADCANGFILDGFPRTVAQAEALDAMLIQQKRSIDRVIRFLIDDSELVARLSGRRTCASCGAMYHLINLPPRVGGVCDKCGSTDLMHRSDDHPDVIRKRLAVYHAQTAPVASFYENSGKIRSLKASESPEKVSAALQAAIS